MRTLVWIFRLLIFFVLLIFAINNQHTATVNWMLGARWQAVAGMVLRSGLLQVGSGLAIGMAGAYWLSRLMTGFLFEVAPADPMSLASAGLLLLAVGAAAALGPALSAVRTDPLCTLRND